MAQPGLPTNSWRRDMRPRVFAIVFSLAIVLLVLLLAGVILSPALGRLDASLSAAVRSVRMPVLTTIAIWVTSISNTATMLVLVPLTALVLWLLGRHSGAVVVLVTVAGGRLLGSAIQVLVHRARPVGVALIALPSSYSFPSGHALTAALFFGTLSFIALGEVKNPAVRYALVTAFSALAVAIGLSRVYLGVHYLGDVVAGWLLGSAVVVVAILGYFALSRPHDD
jgi:membrane-associated phospholipid phosphatase